MRFSILTTSIIIIIMAVFYFLFTKTTPSSTLPTRRSTPSSPRVCPQVLVALSARSPSPAKRPRNTAPPRSPMSWSVRKPTLKTSKA